MAAIRALLIVLVLAAFFLVGIPAQLAIVRFAPLARDRMPVLFCRSLLFLLRIRLSVRGVPAGDGPTMLVANHVSWIDVLALGAVTPFCFLAKREVAAWPILSAFAEVQGTVFVDRRRKRSIPPANRQMASRMTEGRPVLLFPEGTTVAASEPGRFYTSHLAAAHDLLRQRGAMAKVDVQPVALGYSSPLAAWVGDDALLPHVWRVLRARPLTCVMSFVPSLAYTRDCDRKVVAAACREVIAATLRQTRTATAPQTGIAAPGLDPAVTGA